MALIDRIIAVITVPKFKLNIGGMGKMTNTNNTIETPEVYERYQEFLPSFLQFIEAVKTKLAPVCDYDTLRNFISEELSKVGVNERNEALFLRIKKECDEYGYEDWEDSSIILVEQFYANIDSLIDEIQEYVEFLDILELSEKAV